MTSKHFPSACQSGMSFPIFAIHDSPSGHLAQVYFTGEEFGEEGVA